MSAQEILKLIETVAPDDTAKLGEIDARVWCFLQDVGCPHIFVGLGKRGFEYIYDDSLHNAEPQSGVYDVPGDAPRYTRSRDALKAIRPTGENWWIWDISSHRKFNTCSVTRYSGFGTRQTPNLPTEELAELHAIIQAIDHERAKP